MIGHACCYAKAIADEWQALRGRGPCREMGGIAQLCFVRGSIGYWNLKIMRNLCFDPEWIPGCEKIY
jgi:hypothetical protein